MRQQMRSQLLVTEMLACMVACVTRRRVFSGIANGNIAARSKAHSLHKSMIEYVHTLAYMGTYNALS